MEEEEPSLLMWTFLKAEDKFEMGWDIASEWGARTVYVCLSRWMLRVCV
jgi:hypothetical protein